jgi:hypothetical protein
LWWFWHWFGWGLNARRPGDILLATTKVPWGALRYSWSWVSGIGDGIENMATLSTWECGSLIYRPQKLEVDLYPTRFEYEVAMVAQIDQGQWAGSSLSLGKGHVVVEPLSRKAHYKYLPIVRLTGEESSTRVLPNLSLFNIILAPTLRVEIIVSQRNDEAWVISSEEWKKVTRRSLVSVRMWKGPYGLRKDWLCPRKKLWRRRFWMKLIHRGTPFILGH